MTTWQKTTQALKTHPQMMYQLEKIWGIPGKTVWKCLLFTWLFFRLLQQGVKVLVSSQLVVSPLAAEGRAVLPEALQRLAGLCNSSCFRTFDLNLSESSSIRPTFLHFTFILYFVFFFLHVETVLILLHCKHMSNFCLLRWSHTVYSYSFKENKFSQPEGLHLEGPVWIQKPSHVGCLLLGFLLSIISVNFFHASFSCLHQTVTLGQVYARFSSQLPAFGRSEWILRLRSLLFKQKRIFSNSVAVHQIY